MLEQLLTFYKEERISSQDKLGKLTGRSGKYQKNAPIDIYQLFPRIRKYISK